MMANSWLCEQIHGVMRHGLHSAHGMDQVATQQSYSTSTDYDTKRERKEMVMEGKGQPVTKRRKSIDQNTTKSQHEKLIHQLLDRVQKWFRKSKDLVSAPGDGIPADAEINKNGRRQQDKANLRTQIAAENAKVASLTREKITINMVIEMA